MDVARSLGLEKDTPILGAKVGYDSIRRDADRWARIACISRYGSRFVDRMKSLRKRHLRVTQCLW